MVRNYRSRQDPELLEQLQKFPRGYVVVDDVIYPAKFAAPHLVDSLEGQELAREFRKKLSG